MLNSKQQAILQLFGPDRRANGAAFSLFSVGLLDLSDGGTAYFAFNPQALSAEFEEAYETYRSAVERHERARQRFAEFRDVEQVTLTVLNRRRSRLHNEAASLFNKEHSAVGWDHETTRRWIAAMVGADLPWVNNKRLSVSEANVAALESVARGFSAPQQVCSS